MGLPTMIKANMTTEQLEAYTLHLRIQEISEKLRINDVVPADGDRYVPIHQISLNHHSTLSCLGLHLPLHNTTILVVASIRGNIATVNALRMSDTSRSKKR